MFEETLYTTDELWDFTQFFGECVQNWIPEERLEEAKKYRIMMNDIVSNMPKGGGITIFNEDNIRYGIGLTNTRRKMTDPFPQD